MTLNFVFYFMYMCSIRVADVTSSSGKMKILIGLCFLLIPGFVSQIVNLEHEMTKC